MVQIVRVVENLPEGFEALRAQAQAEGVRNMTLLADEWTDGSNRFDEPGALFAAFLDGDLAGVGGLTPQAGLARPAMRMRRLYVAHGFRRSGVGQALATAMIQQGLQEASILTANARASAAAGPFWEALGFAPAPERSNFTHWMQD